MASSSKRDDSTEKTNGAPPPGASAVPMLNSIEAAARLGVSLRTFQRMRSKRSEGIPGQVTVAGKFGPEWAFPVDAIDAIANRGEEDLEPPVDTVDQAQAALMREVVAASKVVHQTAADAIRAGVEAIKGTDHRTSLLLQELTRAGDVVKDSQTMALEAVRLVRDLIIEGAKLEAETIKQTADQSIRIQRTRVAERGVNLFAPIIKKGLARAIGAPGLAVEAEAETLAAVVEDLQRDGKVPALVEVFDDEQRDAIDLLMAAAIGKDKIRAALKKLKDSTTPEQAIKLGSILNQRQQTAFASLFEFAEDDEPAKESK